MILLILKTFFVICMSLIIISFPFLFIALLIKEFKEAWNYQKKIK
tara:strand:- start:340 stop:474 length:135 start_codon:yes stop_codon:yes gene_type:complete